MPFHVVLSVGVRTEEETLATRAGGGLSTAIPFTRRGQSLWPVGAGLYAAI